MMMRIAYKTIIFTVLIMLACSCGQAKKVSAQTRHVEKHNEGTTENSSDIHILPVKRNSSFILKKDIDLGGNTYIIPEGVTIKGKKGVIKNGTLIGRDTKIEGNHPVFDRVTIKGDWIVPEISTMMFKDLGYDNSLRDVMALTNEKIDNQVKIHKGVYYIRLLENEETGIVIRTNTSVILEGEVRLKPNNFSNYCIVRISGSNCSIEGPGVIVGDKKTHTGKAGEWGMGVEFAASCIASVSGVTIKDCWGDCIYVGGESKKITISNCILDNGRRQGISITSADSVYIKDCVITNVSGTDPQYAIDIEPNANQMVSNVTVKNVSAVNCVGGFEIWGKAKNAKVENVVLSNCSSSGTTTKYPFLLMTADNVTVEKCTVDSDSDYSVLAQEIISLKAHNNTFKAKGRKPLNVIQCKKEDILNNQNIIKK